MRSSSPSVCRRRQLWRKVYGIEASQHTPLAKIVVGLNSSAWIDFSWFHLAMLTTDTDTDIDVEKGMCIYPSLSLSLFCACRGLIPLYLCVLLFAFEFQY